MDLIILKKKLSSYRTQKGQLRGMHDEMLLEVLRAWENWTGSFKELARELGLTRRQLSPVLGKAKKIQRHRGLSGTEDFQEIATNVIEDLAIPRGNSGIEVQWQSGMVIRFAQVQQLTEFLKLIA